jgi:hypothetical protein
MEQGGALNLRCYKTRPVPTVFDAVDCFYFAQAGTILSLFRVELAQSTW